MRNLCLLLSLGIAGCGASADKLPQPDESQLDKPYGPDLKLAHVEWKGRQVVKTYNRLGTGTAELVGESEVRQDGEEYLYAYTLTANSDCRARWEILDALEGKAVVYKMEKDKAVVKVYRSVSPPVYVYRTSTCFEGGTQAQIAFYTIIPLDKLRPRDPQP